MNIQKAYRFLDISKRIVPAMPMITPAAINPTPKSKFVLNQTNISGLINPPIAAIEFINAIPAAAAVPDKMVVGKDQKVETALIMPVAAIEIITKTKIPFV